MRIEDRVLSIEQINRLNELGLEIKGTMLSWFNASLNGINIHMVDVSGHSSEYTIESPTLTLDEMIDMLPKKIVYNESTYYLNIDYYKNEIRYINSFHDGLPFLFGNTINISLKDSAYKMLCYMLENKFELNIR